MSEFVEIDLNDFRYDIRNIKEGDAEGAIFHLRRAFDSDIEVSELIESEWSKQ